MIDIENITSAWSKSLQELDTDEISREKLLVELQHERLKVHDNVASQENARKMEYWDRLKISATIIGLYLGILATLATVWIKSGEIADRIEASNTLQLTAQTLELVENLGDESKMDYSLLLLSTQGFKMAPILVQQLVNVIEPTNVISALSAIAETGSQSRKKVENELLSRSERHMSISDLSSDDDYLAHINYLKSIPYLVTHEKLRACKYIQDLKNKSCRIVDEVTPYRHPIKTARQALSWECEVQACQGDSAVESTDP